MIATTITAALLSLVVPPSHNELMQVVSATRHVKAVISVSPTLITQSKPFTVRYVATWERAEWSKVAQCETGQNWHARYGAHNGGLGISRQNWVEFGGNTFAWTAATATETAQIIIAERIQYPHMPPDQHGCTKGGW
jgi:hypothetical protein